MAAERSPVLCGNWTVNEQSGSGPPENMAFGNHIVKSIYSPLMIRSLILGGTGGRSWSVGLATLVGIVFIKDDWFIGMDNALLV